MANDAELIQHLKDEIIRLGKDLKKANDPILQATLAGMIIALKDILVWLHKDNDR